MPLQNEYGVDHTPILFSSSCDFRAQFSWLPRYGIDFNVMVYVLQARPGVMCSANMYPELFVPVQIHVMQSPEALT